jgi:hypothetical protein
MSTITYNPLAVAAGKVPPGLTPAERDSVYHGVPMTAVLGFFLSIAFTFYCTRVYAKIFIVRKLAWNDCMPFPSYIWFLVI